MPVLAAMMIGLVLARNRLAERRFPSEGQRLVAPGGERKRMKVWQTRTLKTGGVLLFSEPERV